MTPSPLHLSAEIADGVVAHARETYPRECCGLLAGNGGQVVARFPIANLDQSNVFYLMDPGEQFRALRAMDDHGWDLLAIYHSHPESEAYPSATDVRHACYEDSTDAIYPETYYLICSLAHFDMPILRAFMIREATIGEAEVIVDDAPDRTANR